MQIIDKVKFYQAQLETLERQNLQYQVTIDFYEEVERRELTPEDKKGEVEKARAQLELTNIKVGIIKDKLQILKRRLPKKKWLFQ